MKEEKWQALGHWKTEFLVVLLLTGFAFWVNRGIEIRGLYMDDLYLWSCYGEQTFREFVFPLGSTRFRFLYNLAAWLELALIGPHLGWIVPINILLNTAIAFTIYRMAHHFSRSSCVGALCGLAFLASRLSYYQISQLWGVMESLALWMAIGILYLLFLYLNDRGGKSAKPFLWACGLYFAVCFVHERYMVLLPLFFLVLFFRRNREIRLWLVPAGTFAAVQLIRALTIGTVLPAGTGHTQVAETFSVGETLGYVAQQIAYLFGLNTGPAYLSGEDFTQLPVWALFFLVVADMALLALVASFLLRLFKDRKQHSGHGAESFLFVAFIGGCILCSSVTVRLEMRWIYVSYAAALLYLSWMYGVLCGDLMERGNWNRALACLALVFLFVVFMLPAELCYRSQYSNLYYWADQDRYNSLADATYGSYGEEIFGKTIYVIGDQMEMSDFTAETFFKTFDPERKAEGTKLIHIDDVREIGLVTQDMLVIQENPALNRYQDVTRTVRDMKCRSIYGYYDDGWTDEQAEIQVMAGSTGEIGMDFYYPGEVGADQWITVSVNGSPELYLELTAQQLSASIQAEPYSIVRLKVESNFYVPDAQEQRGNRRLAVVMNLRAD